MNSDISIVIPCYLQGEYVEEAIASCLSQSLLPEDIFVILMDPASQALILNPRVQCFRVPQMHVSAARNFGYRKVQTNWVLPLDADDILPLNYLAELSKLRDQADVIYTGLIDFNKFVQIKKPAAIVAEPALMATKFSPINALSTIDAWREVGGYDETFIEDDEIREYWLHLISKGKTFKACTTTFLNRRIHGDCRTTLTNKHRIQTMQRLRAMYPTLIRG